ncbi:hypothetical protein ONZ51_g1992 [Trametes cubensis]|uniref:Uncharacterized protein n=1 Tax=Trametes cubensis TaxID=1111947 RepID=A0AAD7U1K5_9APHY|nr:hypothetical protein ONZ51_g1992 [Trametes cubensis]
MQQATPAASTSNASPGTKEYLPDLFARARITHPDLPLDPVIVQSLLICLIAQPRSPTVSEQHAHDRAVRPGLHLILRTKEEDVGLVVNLVALTLQHILGISTHKHKIAPRPADELPSQRSRSTGARQPPSHRAAGEDTDAFLRSLFFRRVPHTSFSSHRSSTPRPRSGISLDATPRSGTIPLAGQAKSPRAIGHAPHRSASYPAAPSTDGEDDERHFDASSLASSRRPLLSGHTPASTMRSRGSSRGRPSAHRLRTDPLPLSSLFTLPGGPDTHEPSLPTPPANTSPESMRPQKSVPATERASDSPGQAAHMTALPKAVVVSGLEHTPLPAQRALMRVLTERRLIMDAYGDDEDDQGTGRDVEAEDGTWNLPDGFLMVYVCKWDPHERPSILRGLLDKFSMSADIALPPATRQSYLAYRAAHTPTPRDQLRTLARPYSSTGPIFYPSVHATMPVFAVNPPPPRPPPCAVLHPSLEMYLLDLFAATRHHPALDGTLLTQRAHADAEALARAFRVLNGDTVGAALVSHEAHLGDRETAAAESFDEASWTEDGWRSAESLTGRSQANGFARRKGSDDYASMDGIRVRVGVDGENSVSERSDAFDDMIPAGDVLSPPEALAKAVAGMWPERWDVSEEDVARIFPRVVSHRLRVRDGPDDEVLGSIMWPAVMPEGAAAAAAMGNVEGSPDIDAAAPARMGWERKTVKEILVRVLADV